MARKITSAVEILDHMHGSDPAYRADLEREKNRVRAACAIYEARTAAGLTQAQLAERVGTTQSVIARLEGADYEGHTLRLLDRVAAALGQRVEVAFVPAEVGQTPLPRPRRRRTRQSAEA
jgi:ribosome-binding protein aMBF1 (putative translation factor)